MIGFKNMEQPRQEWWELIIKWVDVNKTFLAVSWFAWKGTNGWFKFLTRLVDGRLKKIAEEVFEEKIAKIDARMDETDKKIDKITDILLTVHK